MIDKIYEEVDKAEIEKYKKRAKAIALLNKRKDDEQDEINNFTLKVNYDLNIILLNSGLIEDSEENEKIIDDYYEYLIKFGISLGIGTGKKRIINAIKNDYIDYETIMEIDTENWSEKRYIL